MPSKKVFSKIQCREMLIAKNRWDDDHERDYKDGGWYADCEGKTKDEIEAMDYGVDDDWMVDA